MAPIIVETLSEKAYELLRQLEALHIVRLVPADRPTLPPPVPQPDAASWIGVISPETGEQMLREIAAMRDEWEREF
ncbi:MAG: hypothetical protein H7330_01165 [Hymenobacteraceae bacterium]|nr:hypothetical protein [Hymenobacteraceae bacterium]